MVNYYGIFQDDNRLHAISEIKDIGRTPVRETPGYIQYFENMSRAMARMCTGQIYVVTQTPQDLKTYETGDNYPNIWSSTERKELLNHRNTVEKDLIVINANDPTEAYKINLESLALGDRTTFSRRSWIPYNMSQEIQFGPHKRDNLCSSSGVADEPAGMDFFG